MVKLILTRQGNNYTAGALISGPSMGQTIISPVKEENGYHIFEIFISPGRPNTATIYLGSYSCPYAEQHACKVIVHTDHGDEEDTVPHSSIHGDLDVFFSQNISFIN